MSLTAQRPRPETSSDGAPVGGHNQLFAVVLPPDRCLCWHSPGAHDNSSGRCRVCSCARFRTPIPQDAPVVIDRLHAALDTLLGQPAFAGVLAGDLEALCDRGRERRFLSGAVLMRPGDETTAVYLILHGRVEVHRASRGSLRELRANLGPGQLVGEGAVLHGARRSATVTALEDVHLLEIQRDDLLQLFRNRPRLRQALVGLMHRRMSAVREPQLAAASA